MKSTRVFTSVQRHRTDCGCAVGQIGSTPIWVTHAVLSVLFCCSDFSVFGTNMKNVLSAVAAALVLEGTFYLLRYFWRKCTQGTEPNPENQFLFFPDSKPTCKASYAERHGCTNSACRYAHENTSFGALMKTLYSARKSVDLCIFCITSPEMSEALIRLHRHGVAVRVVADSGQIDSEGSKVDSLRSEGQCQ